MIPSFQNYQSKMTAQNMRSALAFAVFSFLLVLIATFAVVYRYDLYPAGYGTFVQVGLYHSPNISATVKSEISKEKGRSSETEKITPAATFQQGSKKEDPSKTESGFFDKVIAVFASVKSRPNDNSAISQDQIKPANEIPFATRGQVKFPAVQATHSFNESPEKKLSQPSSGEESKTTLANPEKLYDAAIHRQSTTARLNDSAFYGKSFYDRLMEMVSKDLADNQKNRNGQSLGEANAHEIQIPPTASRGKTQIFPPSIEQTFERSYESKINPRTIDTAFSDLENFFEDLGGEFSSESFEFPEFPFFDLFDDAEFSLDVTEERDSDERDFLFGRNPKHFVKSERLPQFPHPVVDFPLNRNFRA